jgi:hypothetical protein
MPALTARRVAIRILIRAPNVDPALLASRFHGYSIAVLGDAKENGWGGLWHEGDVEGLAYAPTSVQAEDALVDLLRFREVVDARFDVDDVVRDA